MWQTKRVLFERVIETPGRNIREPLRVDFIRDLWVLIEGKIEGRDTFYASSMQMEMSRKGKLDDWKTTRKSRVNTTPVSFSAFLLVACDANFIQKFVHCKRRSDFSQRRDPRKKIDLDESKYFQECIFHHFRGEIKHDRNFFSRNS